MLFVPPRALGTALGASLLALMAAAMGVSGQRLAEGPLSAWLALWVVLPLVALPTALGVLYRLYGLWTARYELDRDGFYLRWGATREQIPHRAITRIRPASQVDLPLWPKRSFSWPGCVVGQLEAGSAGQFHFFVATPRDRWLVLTAGARHLVISPPDPERFLHAFHETAQMGSLREIPALSHRPEVPLARLWKDPWAIGLIGGGLVATLALLAYLGALAAHLPAQVPFGFEAGGSVPVFAPPSRLLLLPTVSGLFWLADVALGMWLYRQARDRPLSYGLWAVAILVAALLWGAARRLVAGI